MTNTVARLKACPSEQHAPAARCASGAFWTPTGAKPPGGACRPVRPVERPSEGTCRSYMVGGASLVRAWLMMQCHLDDSIGAAPRQQARSFYLRYF